MIKSQKIIVTCLFLALAFQIGFGQESSEIELIDRFGRVSNDELLSRFDPFYQAINGTNSTGYILIHTSKNEPITKYLYGRKIKGCFLNRRVSDKNFIFAFVEDKKESGIEFWKVSKGVEKPKFTEIKPDYNLLGITQPHLVYDNSWEDDYCPLHFDLEFYAKFLKANPTLIGKLIIHGKTLKYFRKHSQDYLKELTETHKVPQKQLKFVRANQSFEGNVEFWLVPKNNN